MPAGQPTFFRKELVEVVYNLALLGATEDRIASIIGVSSSTLDKWKAVHPEYKEALDRGRDLADVEVVKSLYNRALAGDVVACIFWLKNRQSALWRDKVDIEGSGIGNQTLVQINIIGANGLPQKNLLEGKVELGKGMARRLVPAGDERKVEKAKNRPDKGKKGAK